MIRVLKNMEGQSRIKIAIFIFKPQWLWSFVFMQLFPNLFTGSNNVKLPIWTRDTVDTTTQHKIVLILSRVEKIFNYLFSFEGKREIMLFFRFSKFATEFRDVWYCGESFVFDCQSNWIKEDGLPIFLFYFFSIVYLWYFQ